jgi:histidinol dehydrogenase
MNTFINPSKDEWIKLLNRPTFSTEHIVPIVSEIINNVKQNGDKALKELSAKFDKNNLNSFLVSDKEFNTAIEEIDMDLKVAMQKAASNIEKFHSLQLPKTIRTETTEGVKCWQKAIPINNVGLYIPGGSAPLFSTVLMLGIPANIAQCKNIILCTPADKDGKINPAILFAARLCGITNVFKVGGAQAIAAMTYGTETIPKVDKIFGPGNQYVTTAKQLASANGTAIDMPAGPSEVLVVTDIDTPAEFAAADLLSQAEHGPDSQVILLSTDKNKLYEIEKETYKQLDKLDRKELAKQALNNSRLIFIENKNECIEFINAYAPEHLILSVKNPEEWADFITQAGSVFMGIYTPESAGDYASGTNHTLPTNGFANAYSGVNIDSFMKKITFQQISKNGILNIGNTIEIMAEAEQLSAHKNAVTVRLNSIKNSN